MKDKKVLIAGIVALVFIIFYFSMPSKNKIKKIEINNEKLQKFEKMIKKSYSNETKISEESYLQIVKNIVEVVEDIKVEEIYFGDNYLIVIINKEITNETNKSNIENSLKDTFKVAEIKFIKK